MSKICQITGKRAMHGNNVSHSKRRTKRVFDVNLFTKKFYWVEEDETVQPGQDHHRAFGCRQAFGRNKSYTGCS